MTKLTNLKHLSKQITLLKRSGKKIVFTIGAYDLIHCDHAKYLLEARLAGDVLVVGLESNRSRYDEKGWGHPLIDQRTRAEMLSYFSFVDFICLVHRKHVLSVLKYVRPNVFYTTAQNWKSVIGHGEATYLENTATKVIKVPRRLPYVATSTLVKNIADLKLKEIMEYFFGKIKIDLARGDYSLSTSLQHKSSVRSDILRFNANFSESLLGLFFVGRVIPKATLQELGERLRAEGKKIVFTAGSYDLLHVGHARFLQKASSLGDVLIVGLPSNEQVRQSKGRGRPIVDEISRASLLCHLRSVGYAVIFNDPTVLECLRLLKPDIFYTVAEEWNEGYKESLEYKTVKQYGGKVARVPRQAPYLSASAIIDKAAGIRIREVFKKLLEIANATNCFRDNDWKHSESTDIEWS
ncbi:MAG: adenylyltransferase/cytidyltransferase family protein [Patescibacteria group bacterium]|nr:adenylyltransferase/cytidyltransferase family protein [Patescibacteria group bacterium]